MPGVFISYRREDCPGHAGRLFDRLRSRFGAHSVFIDVAGIEAGIDFVVALEEAVGSCDVLVAVIGREWVTSSDRNGRRRLDDPEDFLRLEIATALKRNVRVIPVLVEDAPMPSPDVLPDALAPLTRRQAVELRDTRWDADVDDLITQLAKLVRPAPPIPREQFDTRIDPPPSIEGAIERPGRKPVVPVPRAARPVTVRSRRRSTTGLTAAWPLGAAVLLIGAGLLGALVAPKYLPEWLDALRAPPLLAPSLPAPRPRVESDTAGKSAAATPSAIAAEPAAPPPPAPAAPPPASARVPNVVGQPLERGSAALRNSGLVVEAIGSTAARGGAPFRILSQTPRAGALVAPGTHVDVVYARPTMRTLPNVEGEALEDAIATLKASGFVPQPRAQSTNDAPPQKVLSQAPAGGTDIEYGAVVELVYAVRAKIKVPNVVGLALPIAQKTLRSAGLVIGPRSETKADAPANEVVRQEPPAGMEVDLGAAVTLFYASAAPAR
jgi:hypothetical protein